MFTHFGMVVLMFLVLLVSLASCLCCWMKRPTRHVYKISLKEYKLMQAMVKDHHKELQKIRAECCGDGSGTDFQLQIDENREEIKLIRGILEEDDDIEGLPIPVAFRNRLAEVENVVASMVSTTNKHVPNSEGELNTSMTLLDLDRAVNWAKRVNSPFDPLVVQNKRHNDNDGFKTITIAQAQKLRNERIAKSGKS